MSRRDKDTRTGVVPFLFSLFAAKRKEMNTSGCTRTAETLNSQLKAIKPKSKRIYIIFIIRLKINLYRPLGLDLFLHLWVDENDTPNVVFWLQTWLSVSY